MEDINIRKVSLGRNLKRIRKELCLRQQDIVGDEITRNLISMIENDKSPLSYRIAKLISDNMNKISVERNLGVYIHPDDIMSPIRVEAKKRAGRYIKELQQHIKNKSYNLEEEYIKEIEEFFNKWKIPEKKVAIYELLGDIAYYNRDLRSEFLYLNKALENYFVNPIRKDIYVLIRKLAANCINSKRYNEAIRLCDLAFINCKDMPKEYRTSLFYNKALSYRHLKNYDKALEVLEELWGNYGKDYKKFIRALVLEGVCYSEKRNIDKTLDNYENIINMCVKDCEELGLVYINMLDIYMREDLKDKVLEYKDKFMKYANNLSKDHIYLIEIYYWLGKMNEYLGEIEFAEYYYVSALDEAIKRKDNEKRSRALLAVTRLFDKTNQLEKIFASDNIFKKCFKDIALTSDLQLALNLISVNMKIERNDKANNVIQYLLKGVNDDED